ncbi:MAG: N-acetylmuramoyl-L-alanine amidase [bacterium]|nr:N-acetylmuramoyl-L-alanine amidase [bacterium]
MHHHIKRNLALHRTVPVTVGVGLIVIISAVAIRYTGYGQQVSYSESEAGFETMTEEPKDQDLAVHPRLRDLDHWSRPPGPIRVGLQVGHWQAIDAPDELENLRTRTGTSGGGKNEWEVNLDIAEKTRALLQERGMTVDILPVTIPENYWADVFIAIHADGNVNTGVNGFKVASPWRDVTGEAEEFSQILEEHYAVSTDLDLDPNISRAMRGYYAFNWRRYDHSIHPMTVAAIIETGFLTSAHDRRVIVDDSERSARGIAEAVLEYTQTIIKI